MAGVVQTVLGKVDPKNIGRTLCHEHLHLDYSSFFVPSPPELKDYLEGELTLQNIGLIQRYPYSSKNNITLCSEDLKKPIIEDIKIFQKFGGSAIVENTTYGIKRNVNFLKEVSEKTGIHIIAGTGYYTASVQPNTVLKQSVEDLCDTIRNDLLKGCPENATVKCGVIGEVASSYPIEVFEAKAIKATGTIQQELKCPVIFHPGRRPKALGEIMRLYTEAGGDPKKCVMSHIERTLGDIDSIINFGKEYNCYLGIDLFGNEVLHYQLNPDFQMPNDSQRVDLIFGLIKAGYTQKLCLSHDIHTKHRLHHFGGHGYFHLFCNVIPKMKQLDISSAILDQIFINNPRTWLTWNPE